TRDAAFTTYAISSRAPSAARTPLRGGKRSGLTRRLVLARIRPSRPERLGASSGATWRGHVRRGRERRTRRRLDDARRPWRLRVGGAAFGGPIPHMARPH